MHEEGLIQEGIDLARRLGHLSAKLLLSIDIEKVRLEAGFRKIEWLEFKVVKV